jgi:hypothetical protein
MYTVLGRRRRRRARRAGSSTSPAATAFASAVAVAVPMNTRFITLCTEPRWVSCAPFGKPVVPDV